jgi:hypothetical protein
MSNRPGTSPTLTVISWRDIPAQVTARAGRETARRELSPRFQAAIDRAAMEAGLFGTDDYLDEWRRTTTPCGSELEAAVAEAAARLEQEFTMETLNRLAMTGGHSSPETQ